MDTPVRAVLFDYGHTLVDFTVPEDALHGVYGEIRNRLKEEAKCELPEVADLVERVARSVTRRVDDSYAADRLVELDILELFSDALTGLGFAPRSETVQWVAEAEHTALTAHLRVPPETLLTLSRLREAGIKIGIISNAHLLPHMMRRDWNNLGISPFIDASVISSELGVRKPDPRIFQKVLSNLEVDPASAVFVGDRLFDDIGGAHAVGMRALLTREFRQEEVEPDGPTPEMVVSRLDEITPFVLQGAPA